MRPGLQLKMGQSLSMTPQLQQAIRLLQLSTLELQSEIQEALESNPLLEEDDIPPPESQWETQYSAGTSAGEAQEDDYIYQGETTESLKDYLLWQMRLSHFTPLDEFIAETIIDAIDESGYLTQDIDDLYATIVAEEPETELDEVKVVLKRIQHFDPIGVGARSVQECLLIQLQQRAIDSPYIEVAQRVVRDHLDLLAKRDYRKLARKSRLKEETLREVLKLLQDLDPRPGDGFGTSESDYVIPDVLVRKHKDQWRVELNPHALPKVRVNQGYADLVHNGCSQQDGQYIKQQLQDARWLIKSIESRNETLLKVAHCIVHRQQGFFEHGPEAMKPMILSDVAESIEMHESTISRVTTQKFMHTPQGVYELKYFFSSHVGTDDGGECSSTAIRAFIKKLVAEENAAKPLSDSKLANLLAEQGIQVARRTIAKYRESLGIPSSSQRKTLL
ncbi:RNA polymerase factor sigma-54 [Aliidiomarina sanyensis]|uniref:RNA polymerase sigma-54 factor n=1 Tax=Aliidiomarina sanyensis TaxID=1249555 RepID=A0A432WI54_9GAMM|nr:RNA polymerase factor sigma-54 [Aliidiomarina sanyensis]RUO33448.1 RNA polymerase factor sigma-54 [Aliidiomarina sanyensis]